MVFSSPIIKESLLSMVFYAYLSGKGWKIKSENNNERVWELFDQEEQFQLVLPTNTNDKSFFQEALSTIAEVEGGYRDILWFIMNLMVTKADDLSLVLYPNKILREKCQEVSAFNDYLREVSEKMIEIMKEENGIGLAAPQVGLAIQMFVMFVPDEMTVPRTFINPKIVSRSKEMSSNEESCLSLPEVRKTVSRNSRITVEARDLSGQLFSFEMKGLSAICAQHEIDHLNGVLIIDY